MAVKALMSVAQKTAPSPSVMHPLPTTPPMPVYDESISYNIANRLSRQFYACQGLQNPSPALELHEPPYAKLMQCRHCVRYALGYCVKHGGKKPVWREPLRLKLADGSTFRLEFDCQHCQMNVYASFGLNNLTFASDGSPL
jgi:putative protease